MATGFTSKINEGISFKDFALDCARAFGAKIDIRCNSSAEEIKIHEVDDRFLANLMRAKRKQTDFMSMTDEALRNRWQGDHHLRVREWEIRVERKKELLEKYKAMLAEVEAWEPPSENHTGLKNFMREQIEESIKWDCEIDEKPTQETFEDWRKSLVEYYKDDVDYHLKRLEEERTRAAENNKWSRQLFKSLK